MDAASTHKIESPHTTILMGERIFGWPLMALQSKNKMEYGPVRHVLTQMVVAGTVTVMPPVKARQTEKMVGPPTKT